MLSCGWLRLQDGTISNRFTPMTIPEVATPVYLGLRTIPRKLFNVIFPIVPKGLFSYLQMWRLTHRNHRACTRWKTDPSLATELLTATKIRPGFIWSARKAGESIKLATCRHLQPTAGSKAKGKVWEERFLYRATWSQDNDSVRCLPSGDKLGGTSLHVSILKASDWLWYLGGSGSLVPGQQACFQTVGVVQ